MRWAEGNARDNCLGPGCLLEIIDDLVACGVDMHDVPLRNIVAICEALEEHCLWTGSRPL